MGVVAETRAKCPGVKLELKPLISTCSHKKTNVNWALWSQIFLPRFLARDAGLKKAGALLAWSYE
jgi:hypothetical protein